MKKIAKIALSELELQNLIKESIENILQRGNEDELNEYRTTSNNLKKTPKCLGVFFVKMHAI